MKIQNSSDSSLWILLKCQYQYRRYFWPDRQWRSSSFQESKKVRVSRDLWPWPWAHPGCRLTWWLSCASFVAIKPFAHENKPFLCQHKSACITWPWPWPWAHPGCRLIWWLSCASFVAIKPFARENKPFLCQHKSARITWHLTLTLTLSTPWMHANPETILCKFGGDPAICLQEEVICAKVYRQTDGCLAIVLAHLEWANNVSVSYQWDFLA